MTCILCSSSKTSIYNTFKGDTYYQCDNCHMVFQQPDQLLNRQEEKSRYDSHKNDPADPNYRKFLARVTKPLLERISSGDRGLDFGCGPGPAISVILGELGFKVDDYDLYYKPETVLEKESYDFITSTEVFEHFYRPGDEIDRIWTLLKSGGTLGVMTLFYPPNQEDFKKWWYKNDPTHVCFFNEDVFKFIANKLGAKLEIISDQVAFLTKE